MKKNLSYRDKLLELSNIYNIAEIKNYIKRKKILTTSQIELILKKNNVPIPKDINVSFFDKNFSRPMSKAGKKVDHVYNQTTGTVSSGFSNFWKMLGRSGIGVLNTFPKLINTMTSFFSDIFVDFFSSFYDSKIQEKKTNKLINMIGLFIIVSSVGIIGYTIFNKFDGVDTITKKLEIEKSEKKVKSENEKLLKKEKKEQADKKISKPKEDKKVEKKPQIKDKKDPSKVTELVLPNLNLKTETVLSLFKDVEYDLSTVRYQKKVKPIYFTQFPKDLDEIKDTKLKKETFIKIVLPLVVAENEKILDDRFKLKNILSRKKTSDKEKGWLRQKLREYKVKNSDMAELQKRMDTIPVSIALAQAAKESGWGTSRFALEGNAIFGQWTWTGQGIEPLNKGKHEGHKILRFPILRASVKAYKNNLNTHKGYSNFREKRASLRKRNKNIKGLDLTDTLDKYAQTGKEYTDILEQIIKQNDLSDFESVQLTNSIVRKELNL